jgi:hypothetical protein
MLFFVIENDLIQATKLVPHRLITEMTSMSGYRLTFVLPLEKIMAALLITFLTSQPAALLLTLRALRMRILVAIQYECGNALR